MGVGVDVGVAVGNGEWGSEYQLFFSGHPITFFRIE